MIDAEHILNRINNSTEPVRLFRRWWRWALRHGGLCGTDQQRRRFARLDSVEGLLRGIDTPEEQAEFFTKRGTLGERFLPGDLSRLSRGKWSPYPRPLDILQKRPPKRVWHERESHETED